ncbi:MAG: pyridoxal-phosphate dependent enzyme [Alphaproteobacteria bacterium]
MAGGCAATRCADSKASEGQPSGLPRARRGLEEADPHQGGDRPRTSDDVQSGLYGGYHQPVLSPDTRIETLATGDPGRTYTLLRDRVNETGGVFESVGDEDAFRAVRMLARMEGISAEPASGVAFAGLLKLVRAGVVQPTDTVVVNCSGHTLPAEASLFHEGLVRDVESVGSGNHAPRSPGRASRAETA